MTKYLLRTVRSPKATPAVMTAILLLCTFGALYPIASQPWLEVPAFFPFYGTLVAVTDGLTAFLLLAQFSRTRNLADGLLGSAYGFTGFIVVVQSLIFPGVLAPQGFLGSGPQSAVWMWVCWHMGYPLLILLAMSAAALTKEAPLSRRAYRRASYAVVLLPVLAGLLVSWLCITHSDMLPVLIKGKDFRTFTESGLAKAVLATNILGLVGALYLARHRTASSQWLCVALLAALADVALTMAGGSRYSVGWYGARLLSVASATMVLGALLWEISQLYGAVQRANEELEILAMRDALTGLYNRRFFDAALARELQRARPAGQPTSVLLMDIDYFKDYNDIFGHVQGDTCLAKVARMLERQVLRPGDFVARYGGEEFVVVLLNTNEQGAMLVAERMRKAVEGMKIPHSSPRSTTGVVTLSIGAATAPSTAVESPEAVLHAADGALYRSKEKGRNTVTLAERP